MQTKSMFSRDEAELIRIETGVVDKLPKPSMGIGDGERWTREALLKWGKSAVRFRPLPGLETRNG